MWKGGKSLHKLNNLQALFCERLKKIFRIKILKNILSCHKTKPNMHKKTLETKVQGLFFKYSRRELNPHGHFCPQDFKSCVSTNSTTRAYRKGISIILSEKRG